MAIKIIKQIKEFMEVQRLKKLSDSEIIKEMQFLAAEKPEKLQEKVPEMIKSIEEPKNVVKALSTVAPVLEAKDSKVIDTAIRELPKKETVQAISDAYIRENVPLQTILRLARNIKNINNVVNEAYRRAGNLNDVNIIELVRECEKNPNLSEKSEEVIRKTLAKQIASDFLRFNNVIRIDRFLDVYPKKKNYNMWQIEVPEEQQTEEEKRKELVFEILGLVEEEVPELERKLREKYERDLQAYEKNRKFNFKPLEPFSFGIESKSRLINLIEEALEKKEILSKKQEKSNMEEER